MKKRLNLRSILATLMLTMLVVTAFAKTEIKSNDGTGSYSSLRGARVLTDEKPKGKPGSVYDDPFNNPRF
jgi:hypothetical protein